MAYKEIKMGKGEAQAVFGGLNDNFLPKGVKDKHAKDNKKPSGKSSSKKSKIH